MGADHTNKTRNLLKIDDDLRTEKYMFEKSAATTLRYFTGYYFNDEGSCSESALLSASHEKVYTGSGLRITVLENIRPEQN